MVCFDCGTTATRMKSHFGKKPWIWWCPSCRKKIGKAIPPKQMHQKERYAKTHANQSAKFDD